jgi:hypothetical protein
MKRLAGHMAKHKNLAMTDCRVARVAGEEKSA